MRHEFSDLDLRTVFLRLVFGKRNGDIGFPRLGLGNRVFLDNQAASRSSLSVRESSAIDNGVSTTLADHRVGGHASHSMRNFFPSSTLINS